MRLQIDEQTAHRALLLGQALLSVSFVIGAPLLGLSSTLVGAALVALIAYGGLWIAYRRGWDWSRPAAVIITTMIVGASMSLDPGSRATFTPVFFVPLVFALIFVGPFGTLATGVGMLLLTALTMGVPNPYSSPVRVAVILAVTAGTALARAVLDTMREQAEQAAQAARRAQERAEREADVANAHAAELAARGEEQRRLLELVADLETPAVALRDGVLLAPIIGALDSRRAASIGDRLLRSVSDQRARLLIIDLAGMSVMDTHVAQALSRLVASIRLLGCQVVITGISAQVAITMTQLGVAFGGVATARSPQEALERHLVASGEQR